jgi:hypothetical protein
VAVMILAAVPMNSEGGSYMTFGGPIVLFCVVAVILYMLLFARPHRRVPARRIARPAHAGGPGGAAAGAAAVAGGGGSAESGAKPAGAHEAAAGPGSVSGQAGRPADAGGPGQDTSSSEGTEASE